MANEHPFQMLFETLGRLPAAHADSVNRQAYELLYDILSVPVEKAGRCILLRAPRAGHGKTHLLSRIQHHLGSSHEFIPLHAAFGCQIDAGTVIDDSLRRLLRPLPASGGLCVLDLVARRLFASALQPLVASGEVPCQDREGALTALRTRPIETFDFHHPNAVTAHWARENFEVLGQRLSMELAQRCDLPVREVAFWVEVLFHFAATPVENPARLKVLAEAVHTGSPAEAVVMERLEALLGMLAQLMRVVLVADDLEGFSTDETAALRLAAFLGALRQSVERLDVILSLNQDIWQSAFVPRLSGGLADRLSEVVVELQPLTEDEMVALLESRVPGLGSRVMAKVDRQSAGSHARGLIRAAGVAWLRASAMDAQPTIPPPPAFVVPPVIPEVSPFAPEPPLLEAAPVKPAEPLLPEPPPLETVAVKPPEPVIPAQPVIEPVVEPVMPAQPVVEPVMEPVVESSPPVERAPDPMLAIAFLAASQATAGEPAASSWPEPGFTTAGAEVPETPAAEQPMPPALQDEPPVESPFQVPAAAVPPMVEPVEAPPMSFEPVFEPVAAPFQAAPVMDEPVFQAPKEVFSPQFESQEPVWSPPSAEYGGSPAPSFQPVAEFAPEPAFQPIAEPFAPAPVFQAVQETPAALPFEAAFQPVPESPAFPAFQAAPEPPPQPQATVPAPEETKVPDTDRVDDLLRQFRERYGRGSM